MQLSHRAMQLAHKIKAGFTRWATALSVAYKLLKSRVAVIEFVKAITKVINLLTILLDDLQKLFALKAVKKVVLSELF